VIRAEARAVFLPALLGSATLFGCTSPHATPSLASPASPVRATPPSTPPATAPPVPRTFCVDPTFLASPLDGAWTEGDRVIVCARRDAQRDEGGDAGAPARSCISIDASGEYAAASGASVEPSAHGVDGGDRAASVPYRTVSRDGRLRFELHGGGRTPHRATAVLRDAAHGRVLKQGPIGYDEYVEFLGWIGQDVLLREHVDEGPGCVLVWLDPERTWPLSVLTYDARVTPIDCFDGNVVLSPAPDTYAIVDAGGASVTFFDEASASGMVDTIRTGHSGGPEMGRRVASWVDGDVLALAYGAPESGVVARVDLRLRKVIRTAVPPPCPGSAP
jgi:hypothetical protein